VYVVVVRLVDEDRARCKNAVVIRATSLSSRRNSISDDAGELIAR